MTEQLQIHIRWMYEPDMPEVIKIENASYEDPWTPEQFSALHKSRNAISYVGERCDGKVTSAVGEIAGYICYELYRKRIDVVNIAVRPDLRNCGVGRQMLRKLQNKLGVQRRSLLRLFVSEPNLGGQIFFSRCGMVCSQISPSRFNGGIAAYQFNWRAGWEFGSDADSRLRESPAGRKAR